MRFANPTWLYGLLAVAAVFGLLLLDEARKKKRLGLFVDPALWPRIVPELSFSARIRKLGLWASAAAFAILALARPQWGMHEEVTRSTGMDIMVVLDVSNSMGTEDVSPNRLSKAKHLIGSLLGEVPGDRVGVVAFAGSAYVAVPLTTDFDYVREIVDVLGPQSVNNQGTDIGAGIETAMRSLERGAEDASFSASKGVPTHAVVLLTDGEDFEGQAQPMAKQLAQAGVKFYVIGIGTAKGGPVPVRDQNGNLLTYKKDRSGETVVSTFSSETLTKLASTAGGLYWTATPGEDEIKDLGLELATLGRADFSERRRLVYEERFQYPLALAVLLLLIELSLPARKLGVAALLLLAFAPGAQASPLDVYLENKKGIDSLQEGKVDEARKHFNNAQSLDPSRPELEYNQGLAQLEEGNVDGALERFRSSAKQALQNGNPELAARSLFNLGLAHTQKGDNQGAARAYLKSLELAQKSENPKLEADVRKNIELLQQQQKQQQQKQGGGKDDEKKKDQDKKQDKDGQDQQDKQNPENKKGQAQQSPSKPFKSEKLNNEDAERVMAELSSREKELQAKFKKQDGQKGMRNQKDW